MSTKNLPGAKSKGLSAFLVLSLLLHAGVFLSFYAFNAYYDRFPGSFDELRRPVIVEVLDLPPGPEEREKRNNARSRPADRTVSVEKETVPRKRVLGESYRDTVIAPPASEPPASEPPETGVSGESSGPGEYTVQGSRPVHPAPPAEVGDVPARGGGAPVERPRLFLPKEKLGELAKKYEEEAPPGEKGKTLRLNTSELKYQKYLINMKNLIESRWEYPLLALKNGWQGRLNIDFKVKKDGSVEYWLVRSSGYPALDDAAITAIKLASPFPPFPKDFDIEEINIHGQFEYTIILVR